MPGTVNAIVPLSLLEAVRSVDIPEGGDDEVEYVQEHRNKRLGLSDTVIAQIRRYKDALKRNQQIPTHEASGIARLIGRRPDAENIYTRAGNIVADRMYEMISAHRRRSHVRDDLGDDATDHSPSSRVPCAAARFPAGPSDG
jgi:hypothetical protein